MSSLYSLLSGSIQCGWTMHQCVRYTKLHLGYSVTLLRTSMSFTLKPNNTYRLIISVDVLAYILRRGVWLCCERINREIVGEKNAYIMENIWLHGVCSSAFFQLLAPWREWSKCLGLEGIKATLGWRRVLHKLMRCRVLKRDQVNSIIYLMVRLASIYGRPTMFSWNLNSRL